MLFPSVKSSIENLKSYKPNFGKVKNINVIRLSANEGALGTSAKAIKAINGNEWQLKAIKAINGN